MNKKVFLGGTCNESTWRDELIKDLQIDFFNPVVDDWTPDCMTEELRQRATCDLCLYVITKKMGIYSIAEVIDDSNKRPDKTVFCISNIDGTLTGHEIKALGLIGVMVRKNGGTWVEDFKDLSNVLNGWA